MKKTKNNNKKKNVEKKKKNTGLKTILYTFLLIFFIGIISLCAIGTAFFMYIAVKAPAFDENILYTSEPSVILD